MGNLVPGGKYVYERVGGVTYARLEGQTERIEIGRDYQPPSGDLNCDAIMEEASLWLDIRKEARTNEALQNALNYAIMIYRLSKDNPL